MELRYAKFVPRWLKIAPRWSKIAFLEAPRRPKRGGTVSDPPTTGRADPSGEGRGVRNLDIPLMI